MASVSVRDVALGVCMAAVMFQAYSYYSQVMRQAAVHRLTQRDMPDLSLRQEHSKIFTTKEIIQVDQELNIYINYLYQ